MEAAEVVQLFIAPSPALALAETSTDLPHRSLKGFVRVVVGPSQHKLVNLPLTSRDFQYSRASSGAHERLSHDILMSFRWLLLSSPMLHADQQYMY